MNNYLNRSIRSVIQSFHGQLDSLLTDEATIEYISDLLSDLQISHEEKQETIQGIFELHLDPSPEQSSSIDEKVTSASNSIKPDDYDSNTPKTIQQYVQDLIEQVHSYLSSSTGNSEEEESNTSTLSSSAAAYSRNLKPPSANKLAELEKNANKIKKQSEMEGDGIEEQDKIEEELKKAIVNQYGEVEIDEPKLTTSGKLKELGLLIDENSSEDEVPKDLLDQELKLLDMKKRQRKKIESKKYVNNDDLLLRPNLNSKLVDHESKLKKQELSEKHKLKKIKDKADLTKQKENQEKKKTEAKLKARKLERRA